MELKLDKQLYIVSSIRNDKVEFISDLVNLFGAVVSNVSETNQIPLSELDEIIILWDFKGLSILSCIKEDFPKAKHIIFNAERENINEGRCLTLGYHGILYSDDSAPLIVKGINWVANEQLWFSRKTLSQVAVNLLTQNNKPSQAICKETLALFEKLTLREQLIVQRLLDGYKNKEIANDFSISEHTVKSHIYSIYKKIKVRNRVHAINLARQFMPLLMQAQR